MKRDNLMLVLFEFVVIGVCQSETDCFPEPINVWQSTQDLKNDKLYQMEEKSQIRYVSERNRKKWQLQICGAFTEMTILFNAEHTDNFSLHFLGIGNGDFEVKGDLNGVTKGRKIMTFGDEICLRLLYGRNCLAVVKQSDGADSLLLTDLEIPREWKFAIDFHKSANISRLCMGDFLGNARLQPKLNEEWNSMKIRDFL